MRTVAVTKIGSLRDLDEASRGRIGVVDFPNQPLGPEDARIPLPTRRSAGRTPTWPRASSEPTSPSESGTSCPASSRRSVSVRTATGCASASTSPATSSSSAACATRAETEGSSSASTFGRCQWTGDAPGGVDLVLDTTTCLGDTGSRLDALLANVDEDGASGQPSSSGSDESTTVMGCLACDLAIGRRRFPGSPARGSTRSKEAHDTQDPPKEGSSGIRVGPGMGLTSTFARQGLDDQSGRGAG